MASQDKEIKLRDVRLSFENLFKPKAYKNKKTQEIESYSIEGAFLLDKGNPEHVPQILALQKLIKEVITEKWGATPPTIAAEQRCARPGEVTDPDTNEKVARYDGYANAVVVNAKRKIAMEDVDERGNLKIDNPVQLLGPKKTVKNADGKSVFPRLKKSDGMLYSGCYCDVILRIYAYDGAKDGNPNRVNASLEAVKFVRHGQAFGAKPIDADSAFDEEDDDGDDDIMGGGAPASKPSTVSADDDLMG